MPRTSPVHYINPSSISLTANANGSANDIAVYIERNAKIKVYSPKVGLNLSSGDYQEWSLRGRNRRLANSAKKYAIYARLRHSDHEDGYLVFAAMEQYTEGPRAGRWYEKYWHVGPEGWEGGYEDEDGWAVIEPDPTYWYIKLGEVSLPENHQRTIDLDTGILGTEQFNTEWALNPDALPLRIELGCTIGDEDAGPTPYVYWGQSLVLTAMLTEGWTGTDIQRFDRWEIMRNSGDAVSDMAWNRPDGEKRVMVDGQIVLIHNRNNDDFNGAVAVTFTILAVGHNADTLQREILKTATINIMAETVEKYELSLSENIVSYDPQTQNYSPDGGVNVGIRATDQRGEVFDMTRGQIANASLVAEYAPVGSSSWIALTFSGSSQEAATANIATTAFALQQSVNVRLLRRITADGQTVAEKELSRTTIAFVRNGEDSKIREWIYRLNSNAGYNAATGTAGGTAVSGQTDGVDNCLLVDDFVPSAWSDDPTGVSQPGDVEWESWRDYDDENHRWGTFHAPVIHNRYAEDAVTYEIVPSVSIINATADGTITTGAIAVSAYKIEGGTRSNDILPALDSVYRVKFSIDNGDWTNCTREFGAGRRSYRTYIPAASVQTTTSTIRLQLLDEDGNVIGLFPGITVVKDGADSETWDIITSVDQLLPTEEGEVALAVRKTIGGVATNYTLDNLPSGITMTAYIDSSDVSSYIDYTSDSQIYGFVIAAGQKLTLRLYKSGTLVAERSVVCVKNGSNGADAWALTVSPSAVILNQSTTDETDFGLPMNIDFTAKCGDNTATVGIVTTSGYSTMGLTVAQVNSGNTRLQITGYSKVNNAYVTYGRITCSVPLSYGTAGTAGYRSTTMTVQIEVAVNLLGTWAMNVRQDAITEAGNKIVTELGPNGLIASAYTGAIERSATGLRSEFTEQISRAGAGSRNLFGFHKNIVFDNALPFIQGYGLVCKPWEGGDATARIYNLSMYGRLGYYTVSCMVRTSASDGYVRLQMNWHTATSGTVAATGGLYGVAYATTGAWTELTATFLFNNTSESHIGTTLTEGEDGSYAAGDINGYIDIGQINSATDGTRKANAGNYIYVRQLKIEYKDISSSFCEADEDIAYLGQGNLATATPYDWTGDGPAGTRYHTDADTYGSTTVKDVYYLHYNNSASAYTDTWSQFLTYPLTLRQLKAGQVYTLSFWARATQAGLRMMSTLRFSTVSTTPYDNNGVMITPEVANIYTGGNGSVVEGIRYRGDTDVLLTTAWKQYFVRYYVAADTYLHELVAATIYGSSNLGKDCDVYIGDVQLQEGFVMSTSYFTSLIEQNARRISLVQQSGTKLTGIDIQNGIVNLFGDRVTFSNADGTVKDKVWIDPEDGTIHAVGGEFTGRVVATSGAFSGTSGSFEFKIDADNREFSLRGPSSVTDMTTLTPKSGSTVMDYFSIGQFVDTGGSYGADAYTNIMPRMFLRRSTRKDNSGIIELQIDPLNGITMTSILNGTEISHVNYGFGGMIISPSILFTSMDGFMAMGRNYVAKNQVYLDGEYLKVKLTD